MFGGLAFLVNGKICISVNNRPDHILMVRIDPEAQKEAIQRKGASIAIMRGQKMDGWIFLTDIAIKDEKNFNYWVKLALDFNKVNSSKSK